VCLVWGDFYGCAAFFELNIDARGKIKPVSDAAADKSFGQSRQLEMPATRSVPFPDEQKNPHKTIVVDVNF